MRALGLLLSTLLLLVSSCSDGAGSSRSSACKQRVVSLHDVTTEAVVELGAAACLVGVSDPVDVNERVLELLADVPRVGSVETVLAQKPTLVVGLDIVREHEPALAEALARRKVPFHAPKLERLEHVRELVAELGRSLGQKEAAAKWLARFPAPGSAPQGAKLRVLVFDCCAPPFTAGKRALVSDLLAYVGAENVFADVDDTWFHTSWEAAVARKPDVILIDDYGPKGGLEQKRQMVEQIAPLKGLPIVVVPLRDVLGTIRTPEVLEQLHRQLSRSRG